MMFEHDEYAIDLPDGSDLVVHRGVMRLPTPAAFEQVFAPIAARIERGSRCASISAGVPFMNSSGIRALATLVLRAKDRGARLRLVGSATCHGRRRRWRACRPSAASSKSRCDDRHSPCEHALL